MIRISEVAETFGVSVKTVYTWIDAGLFTKVKPGFVDVEDVGMLDQILQLRGQAFFTTSSIRMGVHDYRKNPFDMIDTEEL